MKICMIGTGYVGLVSGSCFADLGNTVLCVDKDVNKIKKLNNNEIPIYEPGLEEIVLKNFKSGRLKFTSNLSSAVKSSDIKEDFGKKIKFVLEGGRSKIGLESTIIDLTITPKILRLGGLEVSKISYLNMERCHGGPRF